MKDLRNTGNFDSDELDLVPEALKDLTVAMAQAKHVRGGVTTSGNGDACECGTW